MDDLYKVLPSSTDNLEDLEKWKNDYDQSTYHQRITSDQMSTEKYGTDNITRYNRMKAIMNDDVDPNDPNNNIQQEAASEIDIEFTNNWESKLARAKEAEANGLIIMIDTNKDLRGNDSEESIQLLRDKFDKFEALPIELRTLSNNTASNIFGIDNYALYTKILNKHLENIDNRQYDINIHTLDSNIAVGKYDDSKNTMNSYYNQDEKNYNCSDVVQESGGVYSWSMMLKELYIDLQNAHDKETIHEIKNKIRKLRWNPEIPFSESAANRTWVRHVSNLSEDKNERIFEMADLLMKK